MKFHQGHVHIRGVNSFNKIKKIKTKIRLEEKSGRETNLKSADHVGRIRWQSKITTCRYQMYFSVKS